jgi:hypothetical protein
MKNLRIFGVRPRIESRAIRMYTYKTDAYWFHMLSVLFRLIGLYSVEIIMVAVI